MKRRSKILIFIFLILMVGLILFFTYRHEIGTLLTPEFEKDTLHINIQNDTADIRLKLFAKNKTFIPFGVDSINYEVKLFNKIYDSGTQYPDLELGRFGRDTFQFRFKVPFSELLNDLKKARERIPNGDHFFLLEIRSTAKVGNFAIPIKLSGNLKIPAPPQIDFIGIDVEKIHLNNTEAKLEVKITNFLTTRLKIKSLFYTIAIPERGSATGSYNELITVKPQSDLIVYFPAIIKWDHLEKRLAEIITNNDTYTFEIYVLSEISAKNPASKPLIINYFQTQRIELNSGKSN